MKPAEDFNPDEYMKENGIPDTADFNPDEYMAENGIPNGPVVEHTPEPITASPEQKGMSLEALMQAIGKGGLLGIVSPATIQAKIARATDPGNAALEKQGFKVVEQSPEEYFSQREKKLAKENPTTDFIGELIGSIPTSAAIGLPAKGFSKAGKLAYGLSEGGAIGALNQSDKDLGIAERAKNAVGGTLISAAPEMAGAALKKVGPTLGNMAKKAVSGASGIPKDAITQFRKREKQILELGNKFGGNLQDAADYLRGQFKSEISDVKGKLASETENFINKTGKEVMVDVTPIYEKIYSIASGLNKKSPSDQIVGKDLMNILNEVKAFTKTDFDTSGSGKNPVKVIRKSVEGFDYAFSSGADLYKLKRKLQDLASSAYSDSKIFESGSAGAKAAKQIAGAARDLLHKSFKGIEKIDGKYNQLHEIEDVMNRNLLKEGVTPNSLLTAAKEGTAGHKQMRELGKFTKTDILERVKDLAAMNSFHDPEFFSSHGQGKSLLGMGAGSAIGAAGGGVGAAIGGGLGMMASSPMVTKKALQGLNRLDEIKKRIGNIDALKRMYPGISSGLLNRLNALEE